MACKRTRSAKDTSGAEIQTALALDGTGPFQIRGRKTGPNPTDKGNPGTKRHVVVDRGGIPLSVMTSAANVNDSMLFEELLDSRRSTTATSMPPALTEADEFHPEGSDATSKMTSKVWVARPAAPSVSMVPPLGSFVPGEYPAPSPFQTRVC
jgi:hypothetical protein